MKGIQYAVHTKKEAARQKLQVEKVQAEAKLLQQIQRLQEKLEEKEEARQKLQVEKVQAETKLQQQIKDLQGQL